MPAVKIKSNAIKLCHKPSTSGAIFGADTTKIHSISAEIAGYSDEANGLPNVILKALGVDGRITEVKIIISNAENIDPGRDFAVPCPLTAAVRARFQAASAVEIIHAK